MNKRLFGHIFLIMTLVNLSLIGRELRTPWSLRRGHLHAPLPRPTDEDGRWAIDTWAGALHRESDKAFKDKNTTAKDQSLAGIIFGTENFIALEAFAPGTISPQNPFLAFAQLRPEISYNENSAYFGFNFDYALGCECRLHVGARVVIPFRSITIELENCCDLEEGLDLSDVCRLQDEHVDGTGQSPTPNPTTQRVPDCYAYRLDFLSSLFIEQAGANPEPLVNYSNAMNRIAIAARDITNANDTPVHAIQRDNEMAPNGLFCAFETAVTGEINADGSGLVNDQRGQFISTTDYTPLENNIAAQRQLWIVPTVEVTDAGNIIMSTDGRFIGDAIQNITRKLNETAVVFFAENGVTFNTQHNVGIGDINTEFYTNYEFCHGMIEGIVGMKLPSGIKIKDPGEVLRIFSTGNNRHFEIKFGAVGTWEPNCWFILKGDAFYNHAFKANERVAAPFRGATVKNIGPAIDADISWHYFLSHLDFNFLVPCNPRVGFMVGYELYIKSKDNVSLDQSTATDFLGNVQPLDPNVLERRTKVYGHKVRTEMFHQGDYWELFGGWTTVFAGRNAPQESDWHIGFVAYF